MGAALEIVIVPLLLVTAIVLLTVFSDLQFGVILAGVVFLGVLYFVLVELLKQEHEEDIKAPASGEENAPVEPEQAADVEVGREQMATVEDRETEHRSPGP